MCWPINLNVDKIKKAMIESWNDRWEWIERRKHKWRIEEGINKNLHKKGGYLEMHTDLLVKNEMKREKGKGEKERQMDEKKEDTDGLIDSKINRRM